MARSQETQITDADAPPRLPGLRPLDREAELDMEAELDDEDVIVLDSSLWDLEERYRRIADSGEGESAVAGVTPGNGYVRAPSKR